MEIASVSMAFHFFFYRKISVFRWENTTYLEKNRAFCEKKVEGQGHLLQTILAVNNT